MSTATKPVAPRVRLGEAGVEAVEACANFLERRLGLGASADTDARARLQRRIANALAAELADRLGAELVRRTEERLWNPPPREA